MKTLFTKLRKVRGNHYYHDRAIIVRTREEVTIRFERICICEGRLKPTIEAPQFSPEELNAICEMADEAVMQGEI